MLENTIMEQLVATPHHTTPFFATEMVPPLLRKVYRGWGPFLATKIVPLGDSIRSYISRKPIFG